MKQVLLSESTVILPPLQGSYRRYVRNGQCRQPLQRPSTQIQQRLTVSAFTVVQSARRGDPGVANQGNPGNVGQNSGSEAAMTVKLFAFTCGTVTGEFARLMEGGEGDITLPIPVFLIEHPKGRALFDTGLHPDCQHDTAGRLGPRLAGLFRIGFRPCEEGRARLEAIDRDPEQIDLVINSHFHFDHVGGNALIPNATMLVQRREWDAGMDPDSAARRGSTRALSTSATNCAWSRASTTCSATARWYACRRTGTRRGTSRCASSSTAARSCSRRTPAISAKPCATAACRAICTTARRRVSRF